MCLEPELKLAVIEESMSNTNLLANPLGSNFVYQDWGRITDRKFLAYWLHETSMVEPARSAVLKVSP
jgi:hypothetical protein